MSKEQLLKKAHSKHMQGKYEAAIKLYRDVLKLSPNHLDANYLLGTLYAEVDNLAEAGLYLEKADSINPDSPYIKVNLGNICRTRGDFETAKAYYTRALELKGNLPQAYFGLAAILETIDNDFAAAQFYYRKALSFNPNDPELLQVSGKNMARSGNEDGLKYLKRAFNLNPGLPRIHKDCGIASLQCGHLDEAAIFLRTARIKDPADPQVNYYLCIAEGRLPDEAIQREYVRDEFDQFANVFDHTLTKNLEYDTPYQLLQFIGDNLGKDFHFRNAVDLGCGTGLFGLKIKNHVEHLEGIDISGRMLEIARSRECYDLLREGDITETLGRIDSAFDLFAALDVIVYFGNLDELFRTITRKARPDALFVFSTESHAGKGFILQKSGRYAHSSEYVNAVTEKFGCSILATKQSPIRKEHGSWIMGDLFIIRLQPQPTDCRKTDAAVTAQD